MFNLLVVALRLVAKMDKLNWDLMPSKRARRVYMVVERKFEAAAQACWDALRSVPMSDPKYYVLKGTYDNIVGEGSVRLRHIALYLGL